VLASYTERELTNYKVDISIAIVLVTKNQMPYEINWENLSTCLCQMILSGFYNQFRFLYM
jgi:hypothetical protein